MLKYKPMQIDVLKRDPLTIITDLLVIPYFSDLKRLTGTAAILDQKLGGALARLIEEDGFKGSFGSSLIIPTLGKLKARRIALIGLGTKKAFEEDSRRKLGATIVKLASTYKATNVIVTNLPIEGMDFRQAAQAFAEGAWLSAYRFQLYHGRLRKEEAAKHEVKRLSIAESLPRSIIAVEEGISRAKVLTESTVLARDLVNTTSMHMGPQEMANAAKDLVGKGVTLSLLDRKAMEKLGMGAALSVAAGSLKEPLGVHLIYKPRGAKKRVMIVGKAVTFDSGGLSLKPADSMMDMKMDMAGGAAVLGLFKALPILKPNVEVHGIFLAVENMPSGSAYRPGDVVTAMDGTTIEIHNTDAEGRVTLADALAYAKTFEPDMIIDLATLTGACIVALGSDIAGLFANDRRIAERLMRASQESGESLWELPMPPQYAEHVKSRIADLKNVGQKGSGGAISAAMFLKPFVGDTPWAHLDIAGPAYCERETRADMPYGGTGFGVRLLARFLQRLT